MENNSAVVIRFFSSLLEEAPRHLIRDRDKVYGERFSRQAKTLEIREAVIRAPFAVAKRICRAGDWLDSPGMPQPRRRAQ